MLGLADQAGRGMLGWLTGLPGHWEVIIVLAVILLLFGGKKLPELAKGLGRALRSFKQEVKGVSTDSDEEPDEKK